MGMIEEAEYPSVDLEELLGRKLNDIEEKNSPKVLYCAGPMKLPLQGPKVAVIGSRDATEEGLSNAEEITKVLVKNRVIVVSGLAKGIDTMAHQTTIQNNGKTIAVIGTPLNKAYPKINYKLQEKMMREYLVISQYPVGSNTYPSNFVLRNRTMALISDASIIVQAKEKGGSLHQGWEALRLGRPLFICKSVVEDQNLKWPAEMQKYGAIKLDDYEDILEYLPSNIEMAQPIGS